MRLTPISQLRCHSSPSEWIPSHLHCCEEDVPWGSQAFSCLWQTLLPHFLSCSISGLAGEPLLGLQPSQQLADVPSGHRHCHATGLASCCPAKPKQLGQSRASLLRWDL